MATNLYFTQGVSSESNLYEDIIIESIQMMGQDVYYIPREVVHQNTIFNDEILGKFEDVYQIEMYIENVEGFDGEGDLFSKFGVEIRDAATFILARRRWNKEIASKYGYDSKKYYRPREGDLIYLPLSQSTFEISKVDTESPFYQVNDLPVFKLRCELFEYNNEQFDTGVEEIDWVETFGAYQYILTMDSASSGYTIGEEVIQTFPNYEMRGEVINWMDSDKKLYLAHVGSNDGLYREFSIAEQLIGQTSAAVATPTLVEESQQIQKSVGVDPFDVSVFEFIDFSEKNPFGELS